MSNHIENKNQNDQGKKCWKNVVAALAGTSLALLFFIIASVCGKITKDSNASRTILTKQILPMISAAAPTTPVQTPPPAENKLEKFKEKIKLLKAGYDQENAAALALFESEMDVVGKDDFQQAYKNITPTVRFFAKFKSCGYLIYAMARDRIKDSTTAQEFVCKQIEKPIVNPCIAGAAKIESSLKNFIHKLEENNNRFSSECLDELKLLSDDRSNFAVGKKFIEDLGEFNTSVLELAEATGWTALGVVFEAIFWKQTLKAILRFAGKTVAKVAGSAAAPFLDGPLPIGDIIAIVGFGWCAWDIYSISKIMPEKMSGCLQKAINSFETDTRKEALSIGRKAYHKNISIMNETSMKIMEMK